MHLEFPFGLREGRLGLLELHQGLRGSTHTGSARRQGHHTRTTLHREAPARCVSTPRAPRRAGEPTPRGGGGHLGVRVQSRVPQALGLLLRPLLLGRLQLMHRLVQLPRQVRGLPRLPHTQVSQRRAWPLQRQGGAGVTSSNLPLALSSSSRWWASCAACRSSSRERVSLCSTASSVSCRLYTDEAW
jgi:hypothetical protein